MDLLEAKQSIAVRMCNPASIKEPLLNNNVKAVCPSMRNSGEKGIIVDKTNKAKTNKKSCLLNSNVTLKEKTNN